MPESTAKARKEAITKRLALVGERYSQSEIARRTGTSRVNVHYYLSGTRMPAEFLAALVAGLKVNPSWLLTGEGAPWLGDVSADTSRAAGDLLALVKALNSVVNARMGSLGRRHHLGVFRELNEALRRFENLRARLDESTAPVMRELMERYRNALSSGDLALSNELRAALRQVSRFCHDQQLADDLLEAEAWQEAFYGSRSEAFSLQRRRFVNKFLRGAVSHSELCRQTSIICGSMSRVGRHGEARALARSVLAMVNHDKTLESYPNLQMRLAICEMELGRMEDALARCARYYNRVPPDRRILMESHRVRIQLFSGSVTFDEVWARDTASDWVRSEAVVQFANWSEDAGILERACGRYIGKPPTMSSDSPHALYAKCLRDLLAGRGTSWRSYYKDVLEGWHNGQVAEPYFAVSYQWRVQLPRLAGDAGLALRNFEEAADKLAALPPGVSPSILDLAGHHRNALRLIPVNERNKRLCRTRVNAVEFFREAVRNGFGAFRGFA